MPKMRCQPASADVLKVLIVVIVGTFCAAVPSWASPTTKGDLNLLGPGNAAVADLNGDHIPDRASGTETGRSEAGFSFRMDIALSGTSATKSFTVLSDEPMGVNVEALDVDGDHDLDLVISSHLLHRPVGVWLNDGTGLFSPSDSARYGTLLWQRKGGLNASTDPRPQITNSERRPSLYLDWIQPVIVRIVHPDPTPLPSFETRSCSRCLIRLRAPPSSLL